MWFNFAFYIILLSQVLVISLYYPRRMFERNAHVLRTYPPEQFPKLYENNHYEKPELVVQRVLRRYQLMSYAIVAIGLAILVVMFITGYEPRNIKENQHLAFVMTFAAVQIVPHVYLEVATARWYRHVREAQNPTTRSAELRRRRLFDFISPSFLVTAVLLFSVWLTLYVFHHLDLTAWDWPQYVTVLGITAINLLFAVIIYWSIYGKKIDPHQLYKDQLKRTEAVVKLHVFASIGMSLFLITMDLVNIYRLDMLEPAFMSVYLQLMCIIGVGQMLRTFPVETIDIDVYKTDQP